jgi:hypothetical protein
MQRGARVSAQGDLVKVGCAACQHVAPLPMALLKLGLSPAVQVLD